MRFRLPMGRYSQQPVAPFPLPRNVEFADACRQVIDQLCEDIAGFNAIILDLPEGASALNRPALLGSAVQRPFTTIAHKFVYADGLSQASALLYSLIQNHPFTDANKRTAYLSCVYFLQQCGYWKSEPFLSGNEAQAYEQLVLDIAREGDDIAHELRAARYTPSEIAYRLDHIFAGSRRRRFRLQRASTGLWGSLLGFIRRGAHEEHIE